MTEICQTLLMVSVAYGQRRIQRGRMRNVHPPSSISEMCISENVRTKCITFGEALRIRVKKIKQNLCENYSKSTKIAITACKFSKIVRGSMPADPLEPFFFLNQLQICSAKKKYACKSVGNYASHF